MHELRRTFTPCRSLFIVISLRGNAGDDKITLQRHFHLTGRIPVRHDSSARLESQG